jgi:hypothetical protein
MKLSEAYPSKWLAAEDAEDADLIVTIADVTQETMKSNGGKDERKLCLTFEEKGIKPMICNKTNAGTISKIYGDETDDWIGKKIAVYATEVQFGTEIMMGLRVRLKAPRSPVVKPAPAETPARPSRPVKGQTAPTVADEDDEDLPF